MKFAFVFVFYIKAIKSYSTNTTDRHTLPMSRRVVAIFRSVAKSFFIGAMRGSASHSDDWLQICRQARALMPPTYSYQTSITLRCFGLQMNRKIVEIINTGVASVPCDTASNVIYRRQQEMLPAQHRELTLISPPIPLRLYTLPC